MIIAIDPGKDKCGLAVLNEDGWVLEKKVVESFRLAERVRELFLKYRPTAIVVGRGHFGKKLARQLDDLPANVNLVFVSEKDTTWLARKRYWQENPPAGWWRLIPTSLRTPPVPVDDHAAVIIGERYLNS
jgi:RNase H-fold protein (predicted Holliday junction resolvase)